jgi:wyosine [tRNA(Phe)-imidazoG37] synthetase (radical SAM superfamily)
MRPRERSRSATVHPLPRRNFLGNRYVHCVLSQRAGGLSVGINVNPDKRCNFDCVYCEVDRTPRGGPARLPVSAMLEELERVLDGIFHQRPPNGADASAPALALPFREVALSGEGEPTLSPNFSEIVGAVTGLRTRRVYPFFKIVLITNATGLGREDVRVGISALHAQDEIWAKLDVGTPEGLQQINRTVVPLDAILANIRDLARQRPVVIQSLFPMLHGSGPTQEDIAAFVGCLKELKDAGAQIPLVQIYSAHRPAVDATCGHLPLRTLSSIARRVREEAGLNAEVF